MRKRSKENFKSLTPKSPRIWREFNPRVPWEEMAMVLSHVPDVVSKYARLKYALDDSCVKTILNYTYRHIGEFNWSMGHRPKDFHRRLTELAVHEATMSDVCNRCNSKGYISTGFKYIRCWACDGSGVLIRTEKFRAKYVRMNDRNWHRRWKRRFRRDIMSEFQEFEFKLDDALRRL
jgi:hypothetical protein